MACTDWNGEYLDALAEFAFRDAILCPYQMTIGGPEFATLIFGALGMVYMIKQGSIAVPVVIFLAVGGVFLAQVASIAVAIVTLVVLVAMGMFPIYILRRMSP